MGKVIGKSTCDTLKPTCWQASFKGYAAHVSVRFVFFVFFFSFFLTF